MPELSFLIKPASSSCNLSCKYCFYHSLSEQRSVKNYEMMDLKTLEIIVKKGLEEGERKVNFSFQGGEPTLAGLNFFKKLIEYQKKYNFKKLTIENSIQTNGILIDEKWAEFLSINNFLVGLSLDGPKDVHDMHRIDNNNKGSYNRVMKVVDLLNKHKVQYNILYVVTKYSAKHGRKIYNFFKKHKFRYIQFIQCLDALGENFGTNPYSLDPKIYGKFLIDTFDCWYKDITEGKYMMSIRYFDNIASMLLGNMPEACGMMGSCCCQFVIESNGNVYPCDFYATDDYLMGNIKEMDFKELYESETAKKFITDSLPADEKCIQCKYKNICRGGCRRHREPFKDGKPVLNYFCSSYKTFFEYSIPKFQRIL
ncbi:anaerobic sulfatase maturase [Maledivibacter halophilus]|uniref:Radical SAM core domain-containing protein n=1 Tax=Maledivibacter halophilus TaxID=36842 RepID=A0A1T5M645_9FIRM|nr:anaerobic sulfatase maturase [Maledivibacter halophilus]SKC83605.1 uncharacterized protein SAMN02194393_03951 [Maledivibacter halophilus]